MLLRSGTWMRKRRALGRTAAPCKKRRKLLRSKSQQQQQHQQERKQQPGSATEQETAAAPVQQQQQCATDSVLLRAPIDVVECVSLFLTVPDAQAVLSTCKGFAADGGAWATVVREAVGRTAHRSVFGARYAAGERGQPRLPASIDWWQHALDIRCVQERVRAEVERFAQVHRFWRPGCISFRNNDALPPHGSLVGEEVAWVQIVGACQVFEHLFEKLNADTYNNYPYCNKSREWAQCAVHKRLFDATSHFAVVRPQDPWTHLYTALGTLCPRTPGILIRVATLRIEHVLEAWQREVYDLATSTGDAEERHPALEEIPFNLWSGSDTAMHEARRVLSSTIRGVLDVAPGPFEAFARQLRKRTRDVTRLVRNHPDAARLYPNVFLPTYEDLWYGTGKFGMESVFQTASVAVAAGFGGHELVSELAIAAGEWIGMKELQDVFLLERETNDDFTSATCLVVSFLAGMVAFADRNDDAVHGDAAPQLPEPFLRPWAAMLRRANAHFEYHVQFLETMHSSRAKAAASFSYLAWNNTARALEALAR